MRTSRQCWWMPRYLASCHSTARECAHRDGSGIISISNCFVSQASRASLLVLVPATQRQHGNPPPFCSLRFPISRWYYVARALPGEAFP